jgi:hypothetical protein
MVHIPKWEFWDVTQSEEVTIIKVVPNYTFFLYKFSGNFSHPLAIFTGDNSISAVILEFENKL